MKTDAKSSRIRMGLLTVIFAISTPAISAPDPVPGTKTSLDPVESINAFACDLYRQLATNTTDNLFFSPYSISSSMALAYAGADGETEAEIAKALHFSNQESTHRTLGFVEQYLTEIGTNCATHLSIANSLWIQNDISINPDFLNLCSSNYAARIDSLNFSNRTESCEIINSWANEQTEGNIQHLISPDALTSDTAIILANAIHLKAPWDSPFMEFSTRPRSFTHHDGSTSTVPTMRKWQTHSIAQTISHEAIILPYKGGELTMTILLPYTNIGLPFLEQRLTPRLITHQSFESKEVILLLPKFKVDQSQLQLKSPLSRLGIQNAFNREKADFTTMHASGQLFLDQVIHSAQIEIDEYGTTASSVLLSGTRAGRYVEPPPEFRIDHPFLFYIQDKSGIILFIGRVNNPLQP